MAVDTRAGRDGGFTLLEVMVAFVIAALAIAALLQGAGTGLAAARAAADMQDAISRAKSRLAALAAAVAAAPPSPGEQSGAAGRFRWRTDVQLLATAPRPGGGPRPALYALSATIFWDGNHQVALQTRAIGLVPAAAP